MDPANTKIKRMELISSDFLPANGVVMNTSKVTAGQQLWTVMQLLHNIVKPKYTYIHTIVEMYT